MRELSLAAGLSEKYVQKLIERDATRPDAVKLAAVAREAGVSADWLIQGVGEPGGGATNDATAAAETELTLDRDGSPLERALGEAFSPAAGHLVRDLLAVQHALGGARRWESTDGDLVAAAKRWLDAAMSLRHEGRSVDAQELLVRVTVGKGSVATQAHARHKAEVAEHVAEHVAAHQPAADEDEGVDPKAVARLKRTATRKKGDRR